MPTVRQLYITFSYKCFPNLLDIVFPLAEQVDITNQLRRCLLRLIFQLCDLRRTCPSHEAGHYHLGFNRGVVRPNYCKRVNHDRVGGAAGEPLEVFLGPLASIEDRSRRPAARQQHRTFGWLKVDAVEHGFYPGNHCLELALLRLNLVSEHLELRLCIISVFCKARHVKRLPNTARTDSTKGILTFKIPGDLIGFLLRLLLLLELGNGLTGKAELHLQMYTRQVTYTDNLQGWASIEQDLRSYFSVGRHHG